MSSAAPVDGGAGRCIAGIFDPEPVVRDERNPDGILTVLTQGNSANSAATGSTTLVADARFFYLDELADRFGVSASSDAADTLLRLWQVLGVDLFAELEGDFAFAIWDGAARRLVLARDILGNRPLHFAPLGRGSGIAFASLPLDVARAIGTVEPDLDQLAAYLALMPEVGERTFFKGVRRLLPAHYLIADQSGITVRPYWSPPHERTQLNEHQAIERLSAEFDRAVAGTLDEPVVASQLSGGMDSSMIVASIARQRRPTQRIVAITGIPDESDLEAPENLYTDEGDVAADTAALLDIEHRLVSAKPESPLAGLDRWFPTLQRPVLNACNLPWLDATYAAARATGSPTLLQGLMGNFTLSHDGLARLPALVRRGEWVTALREAAAYRRYSGARWTGVGAIAIGWAIPTPLFRFLSRMRGSPPRHFARDSFLRARHRSVGIARKQARRIGYDPEFRVRADDSPQAIVRELWFADPGLINHSIAAQFGIDLVDPTGARRVVEACLNAPSRYFFRDGQPRRVARAILKDRVAPRVLDEKRRGHQGSDWRTGIEGALDELIAEVDHARTDPEMAELIDLDRLRKLLVDWPTDGWGDLDQVQVYRRDIVRAIGALRFVRWMRSEAAA